MLFLVSSKSKLSFSESELQQAPKANFKMHQPSIRYIEDLSSKDREKLTSVLSLGWRTSITLQWLSDTEAAITNLPSHLRKSQGFLLKLARKLPGRAERAILCPSHKLLNPYLIHRLFFQLSAECTTRLSRLTESLYLPDNLGVFLKRIQSINSLWLAPTAYCSLFRISLDEEAHERVESGCEACILSIVGSNHQILSDLRASMLGRRKKGLPSPRLLKIVEAWVDGTGSAELANLIRQESDDLGKDIRAFRRQMQHARRQKRRNVKNGIVEQEDLFGDEEKHMNGAYEEAEHDEAYDMSGNETDEAAENYFEESILDFYAGNLKSNARRDSEVSELRPEDIHPAFRSSMGSSLTRFPSPPPKSTARQTQSPLARSQTAYTESVSPPPRSAARLVEPPAAKAQTAYSESDYSRATRPGQPPQARPQTAYSESVYSRTYFGGPPRPQSPIPDVPSMPSAQKLEAQAKAYRKLMGMADEDGTERLRSDVSRDRDERVTQFGDFY